MRVLIAPDSFSGTLSAIEAAQAIASGWERGAPDSAVSIAPLSDGGPGFCDVIHAGLASRGGDAHPSDAHLFDDPRTLVVTVPGPFGEPVPATIVLQGETAYVESAQSCGLHLMPRDHRDPWSASSGGLGHVLEHARSAGAERIIVGVGGTGTVDAGAGLLAALGAVAFDRGGAPAPDALRHGSARFAEIARVDIAPAVSAWAGIDVVAAVDVDVALTGPEGAARGFGAQKFPDPVSITDAELDRLDAAVARFAELVHGHLDTASLATRAGAGAGGGVGWALQCLGATVVPGLDIVAAAVGWDALLDGVDLVITGEGRLDWQSRRGKVVAGVAQRASARGIPVVTIAGRVDLGSRELAALGIVEAWSLADQPGGLARSMISAHDALVDAGARIAQQWAGDRG